MTVRTIIGTTLVLGVLSACAGKDVILPGERLDIRDGMPGQTVGTANMAVPIALPATQVNADWTHRNGGPDHQITHPALAGQLTQVFSVDIGEGDGRGARITADPIVAGGRVFTLDSRAHVQATSTGGAVLWTQDVMPESSARTDASGGGLATNGAVVFVTTGFGRLTALDAATGGVLWVQELNAPGGSAPTVFGDLVYVVSRDSRAWAIEAANGRVRWQVAGISSPATFSGGAGVAARADIVVFPFPSGEVMGLFPDGGLERWSSIIAGLRPGEAGSAAATDISGDPVIDGNTLYVANISGRTVAMDVTTGTRIWTAVEGAVSPVWPVGGSVFLVNEINELVRLDAANGAVIWRVALPMFVESRLARQRTRFAHYGPVLAGGRLIVPSSDGVIRQFDPISGASLGDIPLAGGAASNPAIASGTLYVVTKNGNLVAFR